jgi:hypothetical protein
MTKGLDTLHSIEAMADRATVQELRRMIRHVEEFRLALDEEGQAFSEALVLKLEHLLGDQSSSSSSVAPSSRQPPGAFSTGSHAGGANADLPR